MARGRFISNRIMLDRQMHNLSSDTCRLAFTWLVTLADREGRVFGEPELLIAQLFPRRSDVSSEIMECFIREWANADFVTWYRGKDGDRYIQFRSFDRHQVGLRKDREAPSMYPDPANCDIVAGPKPEITISDDNNINVTFEVDESHMNNSEIKFAVNRVLDENFNLHDACLMAYNIKKGKKVKSNSAFAAMIATFEKAGVTMGDYLDAIDDYHQDGRYPGDSPTTYQKWTLNMVNKKNKKSGVKDQSPEDYKQSWGAK